MTCPNKIDETNFSRFLQINTIQKIIALALFTKVIEKYLTLENAEKLYGQTRSIYMMI